MDLVIAVLICLSILVLFTFGRTYFNKRIFKNHSHVGTKWIVILFYMVLTLFIIITPMTNYLTDKLKEIIIFGGILLSGVYILSDTIMQGITVKYKDLEITTED